MKISKLQGRRNNGGYFFPSHHIEYESDLDLLETEMFNY